MKWNRIVRTSACIVLAASSVSGALVQAQQPREPLPARVQQPVYRVAQQPVRQAAAPSVIPPKGQELLRRYGSHPLAPVLKWAYEGVAAVEKIKDYSCTMVKRERIDGELVGPQYMFVKVRHEPFSVYTHFLSPKDLKGQEAIYVEGKNDGKLIGHAPPGTILYKTVGTVKLNPEGALAMRGNLYPITHLGLLYLTRELIRNGEHDIQYGECDVQTFEGAKINGRPCTCIQVTHPVRRETFRFHLARIFVDNEYNVPVRYEAYDWPREEGGEPELVEEYTYLNLKFNNGFTDRDFDPENPEYAY